MKGVSVTGLHFKNKGNTTLKLYLSESRVWLLWDYFENPEIDLRQNKFTIKVVCQGFNRTLPLGVHHNMLPPIRPRLSQRLE